MRLFLVLLVFSTFLIPLKAQGVNLAVPFTSQAPVANWKEPWQNACEETSVVMINNFYQRNTSKLIDKNQAQKNILEIIKIKETRWGKSLDENAQKITDLINNYLPWEAKVVENPTLQDIKTELDNDQPVIAPVYGKALKNKNFKNGGPEYHMLVISGYDDQDQKFITKEPGTKNGLDFRYSFDTIMDALHDFNSQGQVKQAKKVAIFTSSELTFSKELDGDNDGLNKADEFKYGSIPWLTDSDGDGYADGLEVKNGYSPTKKLQKI